MSQTYPLSGPDAVDDKKNATKNKILQAALACFADKGYHKTTMDDIVAASGLSKGSLYWHFKSKQELFVALVEWFLGGVNEEIFHAWTPGMPPAEKIRAMMRVTFENSEQLIPFFRIFLDFWGQTTEDEQLRRLFAGMLADYQQVIGQIIDDGIAAGEFRPVDSAQLSLAIFALIDALFLYKTLLGDSIDTRGAGTVALDVILAGLKP